MKAFEPLIGEWHGEGEIPTRFIEINDVREVDDEVIRWLREAAERAG